MARAEGEGHRHGLFTMLRAAFHRAGVTKEQGDQIKAILSKHQTEIKPLMDRMVAERRALRDLIQTESVDEKAIRNEVNKLATIGADLAVKRAYIAHEVRGVLTSDQIGKLKEMQAKHDTHVDEIRDRIAAHIKGE